MTDNEFKYWAFLSYSQQDNCEQRPDAQDVSRLRWGDWMHDALETFSIPADFAGHPNARGETIPERIDSVFQDQPESSEDSNPCLSTEIREALEQSRCLIVICSPRSAKSLRVNEAVRYFKQLGRSNRILPIVVAGQPNASDANKPGVSPDEECFVSALRHPLMPDGTLDTTRRDRGPIFADARHGNEKREILAQDHPNARTELEIAKIQLIAGLIGVGFNGLWMREQKRRLTESQNYTSEIQNKVQETQAPPSDIQSQIEAAQNRTREAERQLHEFQTKARDTQRQLEDAHEQARVAERKVLEAQEQAREFQNQLEEARNQVREAQSKALEAQNLPPDAKSQIQEAQNQALDAQAQARDAQLQFDEAQNQAREAQDRASALQQQAEETQSQLEQAHHQVREAENKIVEWQNQTRAAQSQLEEARNQAREADNKVQEIQNLTRDAQGQIEAARCQAAEAQNQVQAIQIKGRKARRLTKVFALMAVLALLAAGIAAGIALRQRKVARQAVAKATAEGIGKFDLTQAGFNQKQIRHTLQQFGGAEQDENRLQSLDKLAAWIPTNQIPAALQASSVLLNNRQRSQFQKQLLIRLAGMNPQSAMTNAGAIKGKIVNDEGVTESSSYFQLAVLDEWMKTNLPAAFDWVSQLPATNAQQRALKQIIPAMLADNPTNTLASLNDLNPTPNEQIYTFFFQRWAAQDPIQAIQQRRQIPGQDRDDKILCAVVTSWMDQQPEAALNWVKSQPESESKNRMLETCIDALAKTDVPKALALAESLPEGAWRSSIIVGLFHDWAVKDLNSATTACQQLPDGAVKERAWVCVLNRQIENDPASAADDVKKLGPGVYRQNAITKLCQNWADTDVQAALTWAQSLPLESGRLAAVSSVVANWAHKDPQAAMQFAKQHSDLSGAVFGKIAEAWSQSNWMAATNWVENLPDGQTKDTALLALSATWAQKDPKDMATYALSLPAGDVQAQYLTAACRQLAIHDLPEAVKLLQPLSDVALRQHILEQAAGNCDLLQMNQAAKYVAAMSAGDDQEAAIKGLLSRWTSTDPESALKWLCSFPETNPQPAQVQSVINAWSQHEPAAVAKWLTNLPADTNREEMVHAFLEGAVQKFPEFAWQWTQSVADEDQRQKFQLQVAGQWMKTDPSAALMWLHTVDAPQGIMQPRKTSLPWSRFLFNPTFETLTIFPIEEEIISGVTTSPIKNKRHE